MTQHASTFNKMLKGLLDDSHREEIQIPHPCLWRCWTPFTISTANRTIDSFVNSPLMDNEKQRRSPFENQRKTIAAVSANDKWRNSVIGEIETRDGKQNINSPVLWTKSDSDPPILKGTKIQTLIFPSYSNDIQIPSKLRTFGWFGRFWRIVSSYLERILEENKPNRNRFR